MHTEKKETCYDSFDFVFFSFEMIAVFIRNVEKCAFQCTFKWQIQRIVLEYGRKVNTLNAQRKSIFPKLFRLWYFIYFSDELSTLIHCLLFLFWLNFVTNILYFHWKSQIDKKLKQKNFTHDFVHFEFGFFFLVNVCLHRSQSVFWFSTIDVPIIYTEKIGIALMVHHQKHWLLQQAKTNICRLSLTCTIFVMDFVYFVCVWIKLTLVFRIIVIIHLVRW